MSEAPTAPAASPLGLQVEDLSVTGEGETRLLSVPAFQARPGEVVAIRGPSGAGKSTFLYALAGLAPRMSGRVLWGETDIVVLSQSGQARMRREHLGFIFQDHLLFDELGVVANASIAALYAGRDRRPGIAGRASDALTRLGLDPASRRRVPSFSGGERQRIAVARALAGDPDAILADEPTAHLDRDSADALTADLVALARDRQKLLIVVSHDPALLGAADRVCLVRDGSFSVERGRPAPTEVGDV